MTVEEALWRLGGVAQRSPLVAATSRRAVDRALRRGRVVRVGYGRYALPATGDAVRRASALSGVVYLRSAAAYWGWEQKCPPTEPEVAVPRNRKIAADRRSGVRLHWVDISSTDLDRGLVTTRWRTLVDCLRHLPFDEALAIADSALRMGDFDHAGLMGLVEPLRGPGAAQARQVARLADARSANPFESVLRSIALGVKGLDVTPQVTIRSGEELVQPDLVDESRRIVLEADSLSWHGSRRALRRDCRRYNWLVLRGWLVLRFAWEDVMFDPAYVRACLERAVALVTRRAQRRRSGQKAA
jgi:very-short-patch-repair endonuclease